MQSKTIESSKASTSRTGAEPQWEWPSNFRVYPSEEKWLESRRHSVGASEAYAVLSGEGANEVWLAKTRPEDAPQVMTAMDADVGHAMEPVLRKWFAIEKRAIVHDPGAHTVWYDPQCPRLTATPDFLVEMLEEEPPRGLLEVKSFSSFMRDPKRSPFSGWNDRPPYKYAAQCAAQMAATGLPFAWLYGMESNTYGREPGKSTVAHRIERNERFENILREAVTRFWDRYVQTDTPPPAGPDPSAEKVLRILFPKSEPEKRFFLPASFDRFVTRWDEIDEATTALGDERDAIKREVMSLAGDAEVIEGENDGERLWTYKTTKKGRQFRRSSGRKDGAA